MEVDDEDGSLLFVSLECSRMLSCSLPPSSFPYRDIKSKGRGRGRGEGMQVSGIPSARCLSRPDTREIKKP